MGEDDDENTQSDQSTESTGDEESFIQLKRNIDDDNAEAAEMARREAQSDKDMGGNDDENIQLFTHHGLTILIICTVVTSLSHVKYHDT